MGEVLEANVFAGSKIEQGIAQIKADLERSMQDEVDGIDYRFLAAAELEVAQLALRATREWKDPVGEVAVIMGSALGDADSGGWEDHMGTIGYPADALVRAGGADPDHPAPDFHVIAEMIGEMVKRSTGDESDRNGPWTEPTFWQTEPHDQSQKDVMLKVAPIVAEVSADLAHGWPMDRDPLAAIRAVI